jgi:hypothetical protein
MGLLLGLAVLATIGVVVAVSGTAKADETSDRGGNSGPYTAVSTSGLRIRKIASDTVTPSQFSDRYSGSGDRWEELLSYNPTLRKVFPQFEVDAETPYGWGDSPDPDAPSGWGPSLLPWAIGQEVYLPPGWNQSTIAGFPQQDWFFDLYTSP